MRKIWRKNFEIQRIDLNIGVETMPGFGGLNFFTVSQNVISRVIWVIENCNNSGTYLLRHELRKLVGLTLTKIVTDPDHVSRVHKKTIRANRQYFALAETIRRLNVAGLSNQQLLSWHQKLFQLQYFSHCLSLPTTWYVDSDGEDFSNYLLGFLRKRIKQLALNAEPAECFSVLTTPEKESLAQAEERESLRLLARITANDAAKKWFLERKNTQSRADFGSLPKSIQTALDSHCYKWRWISYNYLGPGYGLDYYLQVFHGLIKQKFDWRRELLRKRASNSEILKRKAHLIKSLRLTVSERKIFRVAADIIWLKSFRKDCYYHGFFVLDLLLAEVGRRSGLTLLQAKYLLPEELPRALAGENFSQIANDRMKFAVVTFNAPGKEYFKKPQLNWKAAGIRVLTGKQAKKFLDAQSFEKVVIKKTNELKGTCACPGKARGVVRIVNVPEDIPKVNKGDIMVSGKTYPALLPAMKKASAIVTEDGGVTCHAAIVARELRIPCIVGIKTALHNLADGDKIEVDATAGVVKKV